MLSIAGDTHTHTVACGHALGTVGENIAWAGRMGHRFMAVTEHCGAVPTAPHLWFFDGIIRMPREVDGMIVIKGVEANIINGRGEVDMPERYLRELDLVIASAHGEAYTDGLGREDYTGMYCRLAENPLVDIIGHPGNPQFPHDFDRVVRSCRDNGKIIEINASSPLTRKGSERACREIALLCKRYGVPVTLASDAHCPQHVGRVDRGAALLEELDFPEELVVNSSYDRMRKTLWERKRLVLPE